MKKSNERVYQQKRLMTAFRNFMETITQQVRIIQLRPKYTPSLAANFEGDFDYIIRASDFNTALQIIYETCKNNGINFVLYQKSLHKKRFEFFTDKKEDCCLILEFWTAVEYSRNKHQKAFCISSIFEAVDTRQLTENELLILLYITHLYHKNKNVYSEENQYRISVLLADNKSVDKDQTQPNEILKAINNQEISLEKANELSIRLLNDAGISALNTFYLKYKLFFKKLWRRLFNLKRITPVVGPDGAGKGSIAEQTLHRRKGWISFRFKKLYRMRVPYRLRLALLNEPKIQPRNKRDEKIGYYIFFVVSGMIRALPLAKPGKNILMDRYFIDYYASPIRAINKGEHPRKLSGYKSLLFLTPTPNKMVFMGCRTSSLKERKNELSDRAVVFLQALYCEFISRKKPSKTLFLATENPLEQTSMILSSFLQENKKK